MTKLRITSGPNTTATVELDGADVSRAVCGLTLTMKPGHLPTAVLEVPLLDVSAGTGELNVHIPDEARDLLLKLGWTPPGEGG